MRKLLFLNPAQRFGDFALLLMRVFIGLFLIWGVWDNIVSSERMQEFAAFLDKYDFPSPRILAPLSVYVQLAVGVGFVVGLFTRWAGILCVITFVVAIAMVDQRAGCAVFSPRGAWWPSACIWQLMEPGATRPMPCSRRTRFPGPMAVCVSSSEGRMPRCLATSRSRRASKTLR